MSNEGLPPSDDPNIIATRLFSTGNAELAKQLLESVSNFRCPIHLRPRVGINIVNNGHDDKLIAFCKECGFDDADYCFPA